MSDNLFVTNTSDQKLVVTYEYKQVEFPVGKPVEVPQRLAQFVFGHGEVDKEPCLVRLGWIRFHSDLEKGLEKLELFKISDQLFKSEDCSLPSAVGVVPLHVERRAGGKANQRAA